mgnify:CR=1 FL=1
MILRAVLLSLLLAGAAAAQVPEPEGYRMDEYRAPVPDRLSGGTVVTAAEAYALWQAGGTAFVDVLPRPPKPANLPEGTIWRDKPRLSIPGAIWLPNTGYGALAPVMEEYFRAGLDKVTGGDPAHPLLFFCLDDCWMSYNAARRAIAMGRTRVYWMPGGTDDWGFFDYPLERLEPEPGDQ